MQMAFEGSSGIVWIVKQLQKYMTGSMRQCLLETCRGNVKGQGAIEGHL